MVWVIFSRASVTAAIFNPQPDMEEIGETAGPSGNPILSVAVRWADRHQRYFDGVSSRAKTPRCEPWGSADLEDYSITRTTRRLRDSMTYRLLLT
jgi:hypothetical protein